MPMISNIFSYSHAKDHQGSIETITYDKGQVIAKNSYDPWGRKRNPDTWDYEESPSPIIFSRGYTMHEHLDLFGLINMNGRLYDSRLGRMLSSDPFIQNPSNLQNYNRYSYTLNNPLKYIDSSGYHHGPVAKPNGWTSSGNGALYTYNYFDSGSRYDFSSVNARADAALGITTAYQYVPGSNTYSNMRGEAATYNEVFSNFVEPNSLNLPRNTILNSIEAKDGGYSYYTIDASPLSPMWNSNATEFNLHFAKFGSAGGGELRINPIVPGSDKYYEPSIMEKIIHNKTRQSVSFAVGLESAMLSIATYGNKAKTVRQVANASNYAGAAFGMADNYFSGQQAIMQGNMDRAQFEAMQLVLYGVGAGMIRSKRFPGLGNGIVFVNGLIDLGQYWYDGN